MRKPARLYHHLGQNLASARQRKNWTQERAAERCGVSLKYWQSLEGGHKAPAFATLCRIRVVLGTNWDDLCRSC